MHCVHEVAPELPLVDDPAGHGLHVVVCVEAANVPATHGVQTPPVVPVAVPAGQFKHALALAAEYFPRAHVVHEVAPLTLYVPAPHA